MEDEYIPTFLIVDGKSFKLGGDSFPAKGELVKLGNMHIEVCNIEWEYDFEEDEIIPTATRVYGKKING